MDAELHRIVDVMAKEFDMETTICIGNIVETAANINMCYEATTIALASSAIRNRGKVFFADEVTQTMNLNQYHNKLHIKLAEHIRNEDLDACSQEFDLALSYMTNVSFVTAITYFNHVMMTLLDSFSATFSDDEDYRQLIDKLNEINQSLPNVYMLRRKCMEFISLLIRHLSLSKSTATSRPRRRRASTSTRTTRTPTSPCGCSPIWSASPPRISARSSPRTRRIPSTTT